MRRNTLIGVLTLAIMVCALYVGWSHYQAMPEGDLFYTPMGPCSSRSHSFTTGYLLTLAVAAIICVFTAAATFVASRVPRLGFKRRLRSIALACLVIVSLLFIGSFLHLGVEAYLPLQVHPSCTL